jgi:hypothetical protein
MDGDDTPSRGHKVTKRHRRVEGVVTSDLAPPAPLGCHIKPKVMIMSSRPSVI